ncbi:MAG: WD40 repeat domain-containing protein [Fimbriiglobus sp.]
MRTFTIGKQNFSDDLREAFDYSSPYRYRLCGGGTRVAVWMRDEEHDWRHLFLADAITGAILEHFDDIAPEYGGSIELCRDGTRIVYQDSENELQWCFRDETPDGWLDVGPVPTGFDADMERYSEAASEGTDDDVEDMSIPCRLAASADGATVVMVGTREEERPGRQPRVVRTTRAEVWTIGDDGDAVPREVSFAGVEIPPEPYVAVSGGAASFVAFHEKGRVLVCDAVTGAQLAELSIPGWKGDPTNYREDGVLFSDNGRRLIAYAGERVFAWDTADWSATEITAGGACGPAVSPDGVTVATVDEKGVVRFFDAATGATGQIIQPPGTDATPAGLSFSADGTMCLLGFSNGHVAVWDAE